MRACTLGFVCVVASFVFSPGALWAESYSEPAVSNVEVTQPAPGVVEISYDLAQAEGRPCIVFAYLSKDGGGSYGFNISKVSGDFGRGVTPGSGKRMVWRAFEDHPDEEMPNARVRVGAMLPASVVSLPGDQELALVGVAPGSFSMGDTFGDARSEELPVHTVTLSAYDIGTYEVTNAQVAAVFNWANAQGYIDTVSTTTVTHNGQELLDLDGPECQIAYNTGSSQLEVETRDSQSMGDHPVVMISWYGAVAFCNWLSQWEGLTPVYDLSSWARTNPTGGGYRLPTEAEWERAATYDAGTSTKYKYGTSSDSISTSSANYDRSNPLGLSSHPHTTPVGYYSRVTSPVGCYDMSGNVWEWCEDWYGETFYATSPEQDPCNGTSGTNRILRGGSWYNHTDGARGAYRWAGIPTSGDYTDGFRVVRSRFAR